MNTFNLTLDLEKEQGLPQLVTLRQGDKSGTTLVATIYDHGVLVSGSYTARVSLRHPGTGDTYYRETATYSNGVATVTVDEQYAATVAGVTTGYFELLQGSSVKASTADFIVRILPSAEDGAVPGEVYDSAIEDALAELDAATGRISQMVVDATAEYLAAHPEITTTVQDNSVTDAKLIQSGGVLDRVGRLWWRLENLLTNTPAEAERVTVGDAAKTPVAGLTVYGKSVQDGTPTPDAPVGIESVTPNLLPSTATTQTISGVTFTVNADGSVTVAGTATAGITYDYLRMGASNFTLPIGTYTLSGCPAGGSGSKWKLDINDTDDSYVTDNGNSTTFTVTSARTFRRCRIVIYSGQTVDFTFKPALYAGSQAMPYVPYGHAGLWARGRNLLQVYDKASTQNGITFTPVYEVGLLQYVTLSGTSTTRARTAEVFFSLPNGTYTFSIRNRIANVGAYVRIIKGSSTQYVDLADDSTTDHLTFTVSDPDSIMFVFDVRNAGITLSNLRLYPQIEAGTTATAYQPYEQTVTPIPLDGHTLRSLPDGTRDEVAVDQYGHVILTVRCGAKKVNSMTWSTAEDSVGQYFVSTNASEWKNPSTVVSNYALCDTLACTGSSNVYDGSFARAGGSNSRVYVRDLAAADVSEFLSRHGESSFVFILKEAQTIDLGTIDPTALVGPDLTAQAIPTAPLALTYERDLNATLARLEAAIAALA